MGTSERFEGLGTLDTRGHEGPVVLRLEAGAGRMRFVARPDGEDRPFFQRNLGPGETADVALPPGRVWILEVDGGTARPQGA